MVKCPRAPSGGQLSDHHAQHFRDGIIGEHGADMIIFSTLCNTGGENLVGFNCIKHVFSPFAGKVVEITYRVDGNIMGVYGSRHIPAGK